MDNEKTQATDNQKKNSVTLKDIARNTGFSINTVSHALNDKNDISEATKALIKKKAVELGYIKNVTASSLRLKKTKTIAVIVGDISNPFFSILVKEIETFARQRDYNTFILNSEEDSSLEERAIRSSIEKSVDGIIICPSQKSDKSIKLLEKLKYPFVLVGRYFERAPYDYVVADDLKGGYIATKHLIDSGNEKILFLNGPEYISSAKLRLQGYRNALDERHIAFDPDLVKEISITGNSTYLIRQLSQQPRPFTAVLAFSDIIAWEVIHTMKRSEFHKMKPIEIIGFDNIQSNMLIPYPLTSINFDKQKMAHLAVEVLLNRIYAANRNDPMQIVLDAELVMR